MKRVVLALVLAAGVARAETRPHYGGSVTASLLGAPASLDPVSAQTHAELTVIGLVFDTLYRVGPDGAPHPHLALGEPVFDATRLVARIPIVPNVKLHDGSLLTAADVAASLERARTRVPWVLAPVTQVRAVDGQVELVLRAQVPDLMSLLALPQASITKGGKAPGDRPIGTGPFALASIDRAKKKIALKAFDDHFAGRPYLDALALRWFDTPDAEARTFEIGESQLSARGVAAFAGAQPKYPAADVEGPAALLIYVGFGKAHERVTSDRTFRRALDLALARDALTTIGTGERVVPAQLPVPVEAGAAPMSPGAVGGDIRAAQAALVEVGARNPELAPARLPALKLEILVEDTRPDDREIAERVSRALDRLGIASVIAAVPAAQLRERSQKGKCDLWIGQLVEPLASAPAWWGAAFAAGGDDWAKLRLAQSALDGAAAAREFGVRLPIVPLLFRGMRVWHRTDVRGVAFDASGVLTFADMFLFGDPRKGKP